MNSNIDLLEKIELYTKGKMSSEERVEFEAQMSSDESLRKKVELSMIVDQMIVAKEALKLKEQMRIDLNKPSANWKKYLILSLAIVVSFVGVLFYLQNHKEKSPAVSHQRKIAPDTNNDSSSMGPDILIRDKETKEAPLRNSVHVKENSSPKFPDRQDEEVKDHSSSEVVSQPESLIPAEPSPSNTSEPLGKEVPCVELAEEVKFTVRPSCQEKADGEIHFDTTSIKGGIPPYTFIADDKYTLANFKSLSAGDHEIMIRDARNCMVKRHLKIHVPAKKCTILKQYAFNIEYDHQWSIPYDNSKTPVRLTVIDKTGKIFFQTNVLHFMPGEWNGTGNGGHIAEVGLYFYSIEYSDGLTDEGTITVTQ